MYGLAAMSWVQRLIEWDQQLFIRLNSRWTSPFLDAVLPFLRDAYIWAPLYLFILVFVGINFGQKGLFWILAFICSVALTDIIGARLFKEGFERLRPCTDPLFQDSVRLLLKHCSGSFSFVSNHAANHFCIASFAFFTFHGLFRNWLYLGFAWALLIAYAQVYVGVHYPLDVIAGGLLGFFIGWLMAWNFNRMSGRLS